MAQDSMKITYPLKIDDETYQALGTLAANTNRTRADYLRFTVRREAIRAGIIAPRPGEEQPDQGQAVTA